MTTCERPDGSRARERNQTWDAPPGSLRNLSGQHFAHKPSRRFADFAGRFLLKKVGALNGDGLLVWPGAAEFALCADEKACRLSIDEELGNRARRHPLRVGLHDLNHVRRFSSYG